jgi:hypothetical protein
MVDIIVTYQNIIKELHNLNINADITLLDISNIDCANLNEDKLKEIINDSELIEIKKTCNISKNSIRSEILDLDIDDSTNKDALIENITNLLIDSESSDALETNTDETGYDIPEENKQIMRKILEPTNEIKQSVNKILKTTLSDIIFLIFFQVRIITFDLKTKSVSNGSYDQRENWEHISKRNSVFFFSILY